MSSLVIDGTQSVIDVQQLLIANRVSSEECTIIVRQNCSVIMTASKAFVYSGAMRLVLEPSASVCWMWQQLLDQDERAVRNVSIEAAAGARCELHLLSQMDAGIVSDAITVAVTGENASVSVHAVRMMRGDAHATLSVRHVHQAQATVTSVKVRDVLSDSAYAQFYGHAWMKEGVIGSDGLQDHKALLLSDRARCRAHPEIQVCTDQVSCAHGSAIGRLSGEQLAYVQARGLDQAEAQSLLLHAFVSELAPLEGSTIVSDAYTRCITGV